MAYKVSVVIPTYNAAVTIESALDSVIGQTYEVFEIIVVDDGSTDNTSDVVRDFSKVKYIYQENKGPSAARNRGIMESTGELIAFLDADDMWMPEKISLQVERFVNKPEVGLCATASFLCDENFKDKRLNSQSLYTQRQIWRKLIVSNLFATPTVMVRRSCLDKVGLFDESLRFAEDWDMWLRIGLEYAIEYIDRPLCQYRAMKSGITMSWSYDNIRDMGRLVALNRKRVNGWYAKSVGYLRAMNYFCLNCAYYYRSNKQHALARKNFLKALLYWPFSKDGYKGYLVTCLNVKK